MIPFNIPYNSGKEKSLIAKAIGSKIFTGDTEFHKNCESFLEKKYHFPKVFLTNSCTIALEMSAILADIQTGDEVIIPSFTYVSTANAFALRGAKIVFADSQINHPNMDEQLIESLITNKTKAIVVVHYAGVSCNFSVIKALANKYKLLIIEDAAQSIDSFYESSPLGTLGDIACFSFHETKNIHCGEGGFLAINNPDLIAKADIIRNKGTNKKAFSQGEVSKYEWTSLGFSSAPSSITAAFLLAQLEMIEEVQVQRLKIWEYYHRKLEILEKKSLVKLPIIAKYASNNAHMFYLICDSEEERNKLILFLKNNNIQSVFHYQALHDSPYFKEKRDNRQLINADKFSKCLLRLPLYYGLSMKDQNHICYKVIEFYSNKDVRN